MSLPTPCEPRILPLASRPPQPAITVERGRLNGAGARLDLAAASAPGPRHEINEDSHSALDGPNPVFVVADGVGGGAMASRASRELVSRVHRALHGARVDAQAVRDALLAADAGVARSIASHTDELGAATVAMCAAVAPDFATWLVAWVGDCRVYRVAAHTGADAELLTRDDTYRHLAETPPPGGSPDDPARMVGNGAVIAPNLATVDLDLETMLVLCSDGVHGRVDAADLASLLHREDLPLARRCARVVQLARERGGTDDATLLAIRRAPWRGACPADVHRSNP